MTWLVPACRAGKRSGKNGLVDLRNVELIFKAPATVIETVQSQAVSILTKINPDRFFADLVLHFFSMKFSDKDADSERRIFLW